MVFKMFTSQSYFVKFDMVFKYLFEAVFNFFFNTAQLAPTRLGKTKVRLYRKNGKTLDLTAKYNRKYNK